MRILLFLSLFLIASVPCQAKGPGFGVVHDEPYLRAVQELEVPELIELHKNGRMDATIQLARELWWDGDIETPITLLKEPAEQGIPIAQYLLGTYLRFGNRDLDASARWLILAASAGHPIAEETLAGDYEYGSNGFPKDLPRAYELYRLAADQGLKYSQLNVGLMLCRGKGVKKNEVEGNKWILKAYGKKIPL